MILRNIAIIAHVDHGKTTLVDSLLRQSGAVASHTAMAERALDTGDLERERGITILAKCTSVTWGDMRINIVDTPGHADFGGEVERILHMVDGVLLLVDAAEGPMPQTKFVTGKALALGLKPIVVINKVDRADAEPEKAQESVFDLFAALEATDEQLDFPTLFAAARDGWASREPGQKGTNLAPLIETIISHVPPPVADPEAPFALLATILDYDPYLGRVLTGRIHSGRVKTNMAVHALSRSGGEVEQGRITRILAFRGLERVPVAEAEAGDIVALAGLSKATVADTIAAPESFAAIAAIPVEPPTLAMTFSVNDSPLAGRDGSRLTSRVLRERLLREAEGNVAIRVTETQDKDAFEVAGRGELQLGVLIEQLRRDGFELSISRPRVLYQTDPQTGARLEPIEEVQVDVDEPYSGTVVESISQRRGEMTSLKPSGGGKVRLTFRVPSRGMIGYHGQFLTDTRGTGILSRTFHAFEPHRGPIEGRRTGVLISNAQGRSVAYALWNLEERGALFIEPGIDIYAGMIIGEHSRGSDLEVNPLKAKQLTNIRAAGKDEAIRLTPPVRMSLEQAIAYIDDDELVEVTPSAIRLRKRLLDPNERKRSERQNQA
jgi:GTP-binding protein